MTLKIIKILLFIGLVIATFSIGHKTTEALDFTMVNPTTPHGVELYIRWKTNNGILVDIARCESTFRTDVDNSKSSASGAFQFLDSSWNYYGEELWGDDLPTKDVYNIKDSTELAMYVYERNGTRDWYPSEHCWGR